MADPHSGAVSVEQRTDQEWLVLSGVKTAFSLGQQRDVGYADALEFTDEIDSKLIHPTSPFRSAFEPAERILFRQRAAAQTLQRKRKITPVRAVDQELDQLRSEFEVSKAADADRIKRRIRRLIDLRAWFVAEERLKEGQVLQSDAESVVDRKLGFKGVNYREFELENDRRLAVRLLHPDEGEAVTGVDLVYEMYRRLDGGPATLSRLEVRLVALQYKSWNGEALYLSSDVGSSGKPRLLEQAGRAKACFCDAGFCVQGSAAAGEPGYYRMPRCAAFLRPTDRVQHGQGFRVSLGVYLPICQLEEALEPTRTRSAIAPMTSAFSLPPRHEGEGDHGQGEHEGGGRVLRAESLLTRTIGATTFHELFHREMLGTGWLPAEMLARIYARANIRLYADRPLFLFRDVPDSGPLNLPWAS